MTELPERLNDPREAGSQPARAPIVRSVGETPSEKYLAKFADRSFLNPGPTPTSSMTKRKAVQVTAKSFVTCW